MIKHNLLCYFTQHMINNIESFELTHIGYDQIIINNYFHTLKVQFCRLEFIFDLLL